MDTVIYPSGENRFIKVCRFLNLLDDQKNCLSPVKLNLWAANVGALVAFGASAFLQNGTSVTLLAGVGAWLAQAHTAHLFDKKVMKP